MCTKVGLNGQSIVCFLATMYLFYTPLKSLPVLESAYAGNQDYDEKRQNLIIFKLSACRRRSSSLPRSSLRKDLGS
jgi:hypothetical protein